MSELRSFARNALTSWALRGGMVLSTLALTPYLYRRLGEGGFGTWSVMFTLTTIFGLLEVGFQGGIIKLVAEHDGASDRAGLRATFAAGFRSMAAVGVVAASIGVAAAVGLDGLAAEGERDSFRTGMLVLAGAMAVRFVFGAHGAVLAGRHRWDLYNAAQAVQALGFPLLTVPAVEAGWGVTGVAVAYAASSALSAVLQVPLVRRVGVELPGWRSGSDRSTRRRVLQLGSVSLLADSMVFAGQRFDTVIIAALRSAAAAAPFAAAIKLQSGVQALTLPLLTLLLPMVAELDARGARAELQRRYLLAVRFAIQVTVPVALGLALFAQDVTDLWLGEEASDTTADVIAALMCATILNLASTPAEKVLIGLGQVRAVSVLAVVEGLGNVALTIVLVTQVGAVGAALGTLITASMLSPVKLPLAARAVGVPRARLLREAVVAPLLAVLPGVVAMIGVWTALDPGPGRLFAGMGVGFMLCALASVRQIGSERLRTVFEQVRRPDRVLPPESSS